MFTKKRLTMLLGVLVIAIWGAVGYRVVASMSAGSDEEVTADNGDRPAKHVERFVYRADVHDPFHALTKPVDTSRIHVQSAPPWQPPPLKLNGILVSKGKKTALVEDPLGNVSFLTAGDTLAGTRIIKITDRSVLYQYKKQKKEWVLEGQ